MGDETNNTTFDSINSEDNSSFDHIPTPTKRLSNEFNLDNSNNQTLENGNDQQNSTDEQSPQTNGNQSTESESDHQTTSVEQLLSTNETTPSTQSNELETNQQTTSTDQQPSSPSDNEQNQSNDNQFTESPSIEQTTNNNDQQEPTPSLNQNDNSDDQQQQINDSTTENNNSNQDQSNDQNNFPIDTNLIDAPQESRAQRELDENEIPPAEVPTDETSMNVETTNSSIENSVDITDDRPLTALENPYEHNNQNPNDSIENTGDVSTDEIKTQNLLLSAFLPDAITQNSEVNNENLVNNENNLENPLNNENNVEQDFEFKNEDFPPLPPTEAPTLLFNMDKEFPPLSSTVHNNNSEQTVNKQETTLLTSNNPNEVFQNEDVLGNKTLFKQTLVKGIDNSRPTRSTLVTISYKLSLVDSLTSNIRLIEEVKNEKYFVSEYDLISAIDICVQLMNRGESALIDSDVRHCYGETGSQEKLIPPVSSLNPYRMKIELELHDWISPPDVRTLSIEQRLFYGDKKRQNGNFYYRRQDYQTALQCYLGALRFLNTDDNPLFVSIDQNEKSILIDKYVQVQNNVAQVYLLLNKYQDCLIALDNVLKYDQKNVKALFRKGKALFELGKYDEAIQTLRLFIKIQKENSTVGPDYDKANEIISICDNKLTNYQKNEKEIYQRMFRPTTNNTAAATTINQQPKTNKVDNKTTSWLPYIALGSAFLAVIGFVTFTKLRKNS